MVCWAEAGKALTTRAHAQNRRVPSRNARDRLPTLFQPPVPAQTNADSSLPSLRQRWSELVHKWLGLWPLWLTRKRPSVGGRWLLRSLVGGGGWRVRLVHCALRRFDATGLGPRRFRKLSLCRRA